MTASDPHTVDTGPQSVEGVVAGHRPALDGVRGVAILLVVAGHVGAVIGGSHRPFPGGFAGVDVFFVLSGFLITSLLLQEHHRSGSISFSHFYARRALRLLPALIALLVVELVYAINQGRPLRPELEALAWIAFYGANIAGSFHHFVPAELGHTWSLAVEEQFYLLWPAALLLVASTRRRRPPRSARLTVPIPLWVALAAVVLARALLWHAGYGAQAYSMLYGHGDGLIVGAMLGFLFAAGALPTRGAAAAGWAALLLLVAFALFWFTGPSGGMVFYGGFTVIALASAALINGVLTTDGRLRKLLSRKALVGVGRVSYGLYLWHVFFLQILIDHHGSLPPWARATVGLALSALATIVSWRLVERPALRLKRRFEPASTRSADSSRRSVTVGKLWAGSTS